MATLPIRTTDVDTLYTLIVALTPVEALAALRKVSTPMLVKLADLVHADPYRTRADMITDIMTDMGKTL